MAVAPGVSCMTTESPTPLAAAGRAAALVRWCAFWAAVGLPFVTLGLVASAWLPGGVDTPWTLVPGVLALNAVALVLGHAHSTATRGRDAAGSSVTDTVGRQVRGD